ncbi:MAG: response regulator [Myxococcota bacterium]|nr:response regulator [Myxococcota bacterium]
MPTSAEQVPEPPCDDDEIVVIDDDPDALELATLSLERAGLRVRAFTDAGEALRSIRECPPQLVMTDLTMRPLDGVQLARTLRAMPELAGVPLIAVTGVVDPEWATVCHFDAYVRKPVEPRFIVDLARSLTRTD